VIQRIRLLAARTTQRAKEQGASAVEYGLMIAAIAAVIVGVVFGIGQMVETSFRDTCTKMAGELTPGDCDTPAGDGG